MPPLISQNVVSQNGHAAVGPNGAGICNGLAGAAPLPNHSSVIGTLHGLRPIDIKRSLADLAPHLKAVEDEIERLITTPIKLIADIAAHTLGAGGKRLRPALTLLSAQLCGDDPLRPDARVVTSAAAVELTHTTTLLHDDVVDAAEMRRGKPSANLAWGNETSVLVGDYLFAQVFVVASQESFADLLHPLAHAATELCAGELMETQLRRCLDMEEKQYHEIISLKTASLTECACRLGALALHAAP
ncbi:MAG: polyprenyl synthetase family protein, partial [Armatimonadota bacterium]|nr:polyprenyl synthetase family protein [Armatimonadota bacterium]